MDTGPPQLAPSGRDAVTAAGPVYAYGAAKKKDIDGGENDVGASPTSPESPFNNDTAYYDNTGEVTSWYRESSVNTAAPPDNGSTGLTQFSALQPHSNATRGRYPSSAYSMDSAGHYTGTATAVPFTQAPSSAATMSEMERLMPSPARTPTVRHAAPPPGLSAPGAPGAPGVGHGARLQPSMDSEAVSPAVQPKGTLGRSHPSLDGSRGSKFTEGVD